MIFDASHALLFINRARAAIGLAALTELPFNGAVRLDERACVLARALQAEVGGSADPRFSDHFVVRLGDQKLAQAVASRTGQPCNDHAEVLLPEPLARLAVAFDRGQVERRGARYVPLGQLYFDDLETAGCQAAPVVGDSSTTITRSPPPTGQGRRSADPGGTDAARAARSRGRLPPTETACGPTSRHVWFLAMPAPCFKRRVPGRGADRQAERHRPHRIRC